MAVIRWTPPAWELYNDYLENAKLAFGKKTATKWEREMLHIYERLKRFPTSYNPERLLQGKSRLFRSCFLMNRRFKLLYYYDEAEDVVHMMDSWDTRINPKALMRRIR